MGYRPRLRRCSKRCKAVSGRTKIEVWHEKCDMSKNTVESELTAGLENDYPSEASQRIATSPTELERRKIPD